MSKITLYLISIIVSLGIGVYIGKLAFSQSQIDTQIKEVTQRRTVVVKEGERETTIIDEHIVNNERVKQNISTQKRSTLNISGLAGIELKPHPEVFYGVSVSKEIIGPITIGLFGLTNGIVGASVGMNF